MENQSINMDLVFIEPDIPTKLDMDLIVQGGEDGRGVMESFPPWERPLFPELRPEANSCNLW